MMMQLDLFASRSRGRGSHLNSRAAYHDGQRVHGKRLTRILSYLREAGPCTDREVMQGLNLPDMNSVRPRITEGIRAGLLRECGMARCFITEKMVRRVEAAQ